MTPLDEKITAVADAAFTLLTTQVSLSGYSECVNEAAGANETVMANIMSGRNTRAAERMDYVTGFDDAVADLRTFLVGIYPIE